MKKVLKEEKNINFQKEIYKRNMPGFNINNLIETIFEFMSESKE